MTVLKRPPGRRSIRAVRQENPSGPHQRGSVSASHHAPQTAVTGAAIRREIVAEQAAHGEVFCPHTAIAADVWKGLPATVRAADWIWVATAHAAKFPETVEPLAGPVAIPAALARLLDLPSHAVEVDATLAALTAQLGSPG